MCFKSKWITTEDFVDEKVIDVFHRELDGIEVVPGRIKNYHVHFRKKFCTDSRDVKIRISADDYYKLYVNGSFVCQGPAPGYSSAYNYNEIDISQYIQNGENVIAVHVYYQGLINRVWNSGDNRMGMIADVIVDGSCVFGTDESWRYSIAREYSGETIGYDTAFLENIDFNKSEKGWREIDFDDGGYKFAKILPSDDHKFITEPVPTIDVYTVKPERIEKTAPGSYFIDFGCEITGSFTMTVQGEKNQRVQIMCGEETEADDPLAARFDMRCNCKYYEECTLSGGMDVFDFYDYKSFRYVNVKTDIDNLDTDSFGAVVRHNKFNELRQLRTDIPNLEGIWNICKNALKCSVQEGFLDCPSREKGQYMGDFTVSGQAYAYITGDTGIYRRTLLAYARTAEVCKGLMCVAPGSLMQEIADFSLQYPMQVLNYYRFTGDKSIISELFPILCGVIDYFAAYERSDGLLENVCEKWNMVDWPANLRDDYSVQEERGTEKIPCHNVINAYYIGAIETVTKLAKIIGESFDKDAGRYKKAYLKAFYDEKQKLFFDCEKHLHTSLHSNALAAFFGIAPEDSHENIRGLIMEKGLSCGVQFAYFVLKALAKMGFYADEARLMLNEGEHSWVNMLREGATTCFEAWGKQQKWNTSLCHPWASAPIIVVIEDMLKLTPEQLGTGQITLEFTENMRELL